MKSVNVREKMTFLDLKKNLETKKREKKTKKRCEKNNCHKKMESL